MQKLRMLNVNVEIGSADSDNDHVEPQLVWPPSSPSGRARVNSMPFDEQYLIEALLSHGIVTLPEVGTLLDAVLRIPQHLRLATLEGLFMWTRGRALTHDLRSKSSTRQTAPPTEPFV